MSPAYLSLLPDPPPGFSTGPFGKRALLSGAVVVLAADCAAAEALLPDFRARVEGIVLTIGEDRIEQIGPLLWHVSLPRERIGRETILLELARMTVAAAAGLHNEALVARLAQERMAAEHAQRTEDYQRVTSALQAQVALLAASENKLQTILDSVDACIYLKDTSYRYVFVNRALRDLLGKRGEEIIGFRDSDFFDADTAALLRHNDSLVLEQGKTVIDEEVGRIRGSSQTFIYRSTKLPLLDEKGSITTLCGISTDISQLKQREAELKHIAHYDMLTMLPNRVLLADRLQQAMTQVDRRGHMLAVAYLDLDGFKTINDRHGHGTGDQLLVALSARMKTTLRDSDTLARLGGDEFIAVLLDLDDSAASVPMIMRLLAAAAQPVRIDDLELTVSASVGVTFYPQADEVDADQLLRQADQAMYQAKLAGKNRFHFFDAEKDRSARGMHESLEHIRRALETEQLVLHYQPKVNMQSGLPIGVEALVRWQHPQRGLLSPGVFLPVIESHPLAIRLGEWVIETALSQIEAWQAIGLSLPISVNVGARQLLQPSFAARLKELIARHPTVSPTLLEIEILETSALEDLLQVSRVVEECQDFGVRFSLDDFGTGYSSLSYLKRLPVDQIKIDRSFVSDMLDDPDDLTILDGVLSLALAFGRKVIAEGVETAEHARILLRLGCDLAQGYGIARPMPPCEIPAWIEAWRPDPHWAAITPARREALPLLHAIAEHRAWAKAVELFAGDDDVSLPPPHEPCRLESWLGGDGVRPLGAHCDLRVLDERHREAHRSAQRLRGQKMADNAAALRDFRSAVAALTDELHRVLDEIA